MPEIERKAQPRPPVITATDRVPAVINPEGAPYIGYPTIQQIIDLAVIGGSGLNQAQVDARIALLAVALATYDANSILIATADDTPIPLTVGASTIVGRKASGDIVALTGTEAAALLPAASTTLASIVELATDGETTTLTDTTRAVTPSNLAALRTSLDSRYLLLVAGGASVENVGAIESNVNTVATSGATETLDTSLYAVHDVTMDQNCTFTFSNPAPSGKATLFTLILRGAFTPTWPGAVDWPDATQPTYGTPTVYTFMTVDAGTTWLGASGGKAFG